MSQNNIHVLHVCDLQSFNIFWQDFFLMSDKQKI